MSGADQTMITSDGVRLVYDDEGDGSAILLLHGYSGRRVLWEFQREPLLAAGHRVIALDMRCHGASETPAYGQQMARLGQDVRELMEAVDVRDVTVVGHSMGVSVLYAMFAVSGFDRVARFVSVDQSPKIVNDDDWRWGVRKIAWDNVFRRGPFQVRLV